MNRKEKSIKWLAVPLFLLMAFTGAGVSGLHAQDAQVKLSRKQVKELIANAKEPADHEKLAAYYRGKADEAKAAIAEHREMSDAYAKNPSSHALAKAVGGPIAMCNDLIRVYQQEEKANSDLADYHEQMAKEAAKQ